MRGFPIAHSGVSRQKTFDRSHAAPGRPYKRVHSVSPGAQNPTRGRGNEAGDGCGSSTNRAATAAHTDELVEQTQRCTMEHRRRIGRLFRTGRNVFVLSDAQIRQLEPGEQLQKGERVRTAKDSNALLRLADGSTVEMRERSEFSVTENRRGVTIKLERGDVIVEAAKQHNGRLYVQTPDSLVSVKGTIFAVESGTKGSRVSVVEGEVEVNHGGKDETLLPGDQTTTNRSLDKTPVQQNVAWSRNAARYAGLVSDLAKLRRDVNQQLARPGVRYSSKFVDLSPENTAFYAALQTLRESIAESQRIMQERISQNPALAEWWKGSRGD